MTSMGSHGASAFQKDTSCNVSKHPPSRWSTFQCTRTKLAHHAEMITEVELQLELGNSRLPACRNVFNLFSTLGQRNRNCSVSSAPGAIVLLAAQLKTRVDQSDESKRLTTPHSQ